MSVTHTTSIDPEEMLGDLRSPLGSRAWAIGMKNRLQELLDKHKFNHEALERCIAGFTEHQGWRQLAAEDGKPFACYADFCKARKPFGLGRNPAEIDALIAEGRAKQTAQAMAADPKLKPVPTLSQAMIGNRNAADQKNSGDNITAVSERGTAASYIVRRLKRDHPEIAEALANGEYPSARAAGKAAGFVHDPTPLTLLRRAWAKATEQERQAFIAEVRETVEIDG